MALRKAFCPDCGQPTQIDDTKEFCFCLSCGNKIQVMKKQAETENAEETEMPEVKHKQREQEHLQTETDGKKGQMEQKTIQGDKEQIVSETVKALEEKLKEVSFYYDLSKEKKEYADLSADARPVYYLKGQDLLLDLSGQFPDDYRIWWELCKPLDFSAVMSGETSENPHGFNESHFDKALGFAPLEKKRELVDQQEKYLQLKRAAEEKIQKEKQAREAEKRAKEEERRKAEEERRRKEREAEEERRRKEREAEEARRKAEEERIQREREEEEERIRAEEERLRLEKEAEIERKRQEEERKRQQKEEEKARKKAEKERRKQEEREAEERRRKENERLETIRAEEEKKILAANAARAEISTEIWNMLSAKDYSLIDNSYFRFNNSEGISIIATFKMVANVLYLLAYHADPKKSDRLYLDQSLAIHFGNDGKALKFDDQPVMVRDWEIPNNVMQIFTSPDGGYMVNQVDLRQDAAFVSDMAKRAKKPLIAFKKVFH